MFTRLVNRRLLIGQSNKNKTIYKETIEQVSIELKGEKINQTYRISKSFHKNKETVILFPRNTGWSAGYPDINDLTYELSNYNIILVDYLGYANNVDKNGNRNVPKKCQPLQFDHVVEAAEKVTEKILEKLKTSYSTDDDKELKQKVTLWGASMGSMVVTKIASRNEKKGGALFKKVIAVAPVINVGSAAKNSITTTNLTKIYFSNFNWTLRPFILFIIATSTIYSILAGIIFGISYASFKHGANLIKTESLKYAGIIGLIFPVILISTVTVIALYQASKIGVNKQDMENLKEQPLSIMQVKGDWLCSIKNSKKLFGKKSNVKLTYFTDNPNEEKNAQKSYQEKKVDTTICNNGHVAHMHLISNLELTIVS
ncbi:MAG: hypothetical protein HRK26_00790 [Rickettsiaceae bacterium H1]|nr:hypothetical protein [Rickettsiaceae bacterium H1]